MPYIGAKPDKGNFSDLNGGKLIIDHLSKLKKDFWLI